MDDEKRPSPIKAIRQKCLDCSGGKASEVKLCPLKNCPLHPFRSGRNPYGTKRNKEKVCNGTAIT